MKHCVWFVILAACAGASTATDSSTTPSGADDCASLCVGAGFDGGTELDYAPVFECVCDGDGDGITQDDCSAYCDTFGVPPEASFLSTNVIPNDKCVCDGTAVP